MHTNVTIYTFSCFLLLPGSIKLSLGGLCVELNIMLTQEGLEFFYREVSQVEQAVTWMMGMKATCSTGL